VWELFLQRTNALHGVQAILSAADQLTLDPQLIHAPDTSTVAMHAFVLDKDADPENEDDLQTPLSDEADNEESAVVPSEFQNATFNDTVRLYLREIGNIKLLNWSLEQEYARAIEVGAYLELLVGRADTISVPLQSDPRTIAKTAKSNPEVGEQLVIAMVQLMCDDFTRTLQQITTEFVPVVKLTVADAPPISHDEQSKSARIPTTPLVQYDGQAKPDVSTPPIQPEGQRVPTTPLTPV
jgi:hypothetical protein